MPLKLKPQLIMSSYSKPKGISKARLLGNIEQLHHCSLFCFVLSQCIVPFGVKSQHILHVIEESI